MPWKSSRIGPGVSERSEAVARQARRLAVEAAIRARTCHIGSSLSMVDILAVLYADVLPPEAGESADRLLLSKGHGSSGLYGTLAAVGVLSPEDVLQGYCSDGGLLAGHPERGVPGVEMTGGSLRAGDRGRDRARRAPHWSAPDVLPGRRR